MDVLRHTAVHSTRKVEVDNVHDVLDIKAAGRNTGSNKDGRPRSAEGAAVHG